MSSRYPTSKRSQVIELQLFFQDEPTLFVALHVFLYKNKVYKNIRLQRPKIQEHVKDILRLGRLENIQFLRKSHQNTQNMPKIRTCLEHF